MSGGTPGFRGAMRIKALVDRVGAASLLVLTAPVLGVAMVAIRLEGGGDAIFVQERLGLHGARFRLYKLRTMGPATNADGTPRSDAERLGALGRLLRTSSVDELPQLINVLRGEMSLVGPRPLLVQYLERYSPRQARRHAVRPGMTGLVQVRGRNSLTWDDKFEWDVRYVETRSFWLDLKILALTLKVVLVRDGISAAGDATMPEFLPNETNLSGIQEFRNSGISVVQNDGSPEVRSRGTTGGGKSP